MNVQPTQYHYGNRRISPNIMSGDLVTFHSVGAGRIKAIVLGESAPSGFFGDKHSVDIRVTSRTNPIYAEGSILSVSPIWLDYRRQSTLASR